MKRRETRRNAPPPGLNEGDWLILTGDVVMGDKVTNGPDELSTDNIHRFSSKQIEQVIRKGIRKGNATTLRKWCSAIERYAIIL
jgi:hypothetical protein